MNKINKRKWNRIKPKKETISYVSSRPVYTPSHVIMKILRYTKKNASFFTSNYIFLGRILSKSNFYPKTCQGNTSVCRARPATLLKRESNTGVFL